MATQIITSFQLNNEEPIDTRLVVGGTNSFYSDRNHIVYKYDGLRVWDLTGSSPGNPGTPYVYYDGSWVNEGYSGISGTGTAGHLPKFIGSGSSVTNSIITENSSKIGIGFPPTAALNAKLHINGTVRSEGGFYGNGSNITNINASNITSGELLLPRLQNGSLGQVLTAGTSSPIWKNMENVIDITRNSLKSLKINNSLVPGVRYYIKDRGIWIDALGTDKLSMECKRHFRIVKDEHYTPHDLGGPNRFLGIYGQTYDRGTVPISHPADIFRYYAIWGGRMWRRNTASDVPGISDETIQSGWTLQSTTNTTFYESKIFDIKYNFDDDIIWEQSDDRGNKIKRTNITTSYIDITDWGNTNIYNNENFGIFNNFRNATTKATIFRNYNIGTIFNNSNNGEIRNNLNIGGIDSNSNNGTINGNSNIGGIVDNSNDGTINGNSNNGTINGNSNTGYIRVNSNTGNIDSNSNNGVIFNNSNNGVISNNSNNGFIISNSNSGSIYNNSSLVSTSFNIQYNINNGHIQRNNSTSNIYIQYNINNGNIGPVSGTLNRSSTIQDTQVNK